MTNESENPQPDPAGTDSCDPSPKRVRRNAFTLCGQSTACEKQNCRRVRVVWNSGRNGVVDRIGRLGCRPGLGALNEKLRGDERER